MSSYSIDDSEDSDEVESDCSDEELDEPIEGKPRIEDQYMIGREIGRGAFSIVREAINKQNGEKVAVKSIRTKYIRNKLLIREIDIMKRVGNHPSILKLYDVFESQKHLHLVLELVTGGELFDQIVARGEYSEKDASTIVRQMISAVAHLHEHGIAHRDLKPQNLLCAGPDGTDIRVADFGLSKMFGDGENLETCCGSPEYVAPEVLECKPYDKACDLWSVGVIIYVMLTGCFPFWDKNNAVLYEKIRNVDYGWPDGCLVSKEARHLIQNLLEKDPDRRYTAQQALDHPWVAGTGVSQDKRLIGQGQGQPALEKRKSS